MKDIGLAVKLGTFLVVTVLSTVVMVNTLNQPIPGATYDYTAEFRNAEGVVRGSDVRMAGVRVGRVTGLSRHNGVARIEFEVERDQQIGAHSTVSIRYSDLLGGRYLGIGEGRSNAPRLAPGSVIPVGRTRSPVDLTTLLNGFRPLFDSIEPKQANALARSIVKVFEGQREPINHVLDQVVALSSKATRNDAVLGELLDNLNSIIGSMLGKKQQFTSTVAALDKLMRLAVDERGQIDDVMDSATRMATTLAGITDEAGATITNNLRLLNGVSGNLADHGSELVRAFQSVNQGLVKLGNLTSYGSWANVYLCTIGLKIGPVDTGMPPDIHSEVCR